MSTQEFSARPGDMAPRGADLNPERKAEKPMYRLQLHDGSFLVAYSRQDLMDQMEQYRANAN